MHRVDYPTAAVELEILEVKAPGAPEQPARQVASFVQRSRAMDLFESPGGAETIDSSSALGPLDAHIDIECIRGSVAARILAQTLAQI